MIRRKVRHFKWGELKVKNPFNSFKSLRGAIFSSCKESRCNFFIQVMNSTLVVLLVVAILPARLDEILDKWQSIQVLYSNLPRIAISLVITFFWFLISEAVSFKWSMLFRTRLIDSISGFVTLALFSAFLYKKALTKLYGKIKI